ncbi:hypothetical protein [Aquimarina litoralis]|uniref:hypothetical protein n=1 Tax=Aquimarina litoralis TaxID=584605 RepID=UPI001C5A1EDD|nr:hypothetical protein [Aquimarina litoralis]MBW1297324.1 hypothetical protein [Aquimarina litoralis]
MSKTIKKIVSFFRGKKPFKITEKELEQLTSETLANDKEHHHIIDLGFSDEDSPMAEEMLINIYEDAISLFDYDHHNLEKVIFNSLEHHKILLGSHPETKKEVLYYLFKESTNPRRTTTSDKKLIHKIPQEFKRAIGYHLLNSKMRLTSNDFTYFFHKWRNTYAYDYPLRPLLRQLKKYVTDHKISPELNVSLHSFLRSKSIQYLSIKQHMDAKSILHRIILENSKISLIPSSYVFQLLPDPFGVHVNKLISNMREKYQHNISKILKILCYNIHQKALAQIDDCLKQIDQKKFDDFTYAILRKAAYLRLRNLTLRQKEDQTTKDMIYGVYEHVYPENINMMKGLIQLQGHRKNQRSIELISIILERCYAVSLGSNYGATSQSLGKVCIQTLAYQFGNAGKTELKTIYHKTNFRLIKKHIEKVATKLEEETGTSLL